MINLLEVHHLFVFVSNPKKCVNNLCEIISNVKDFKVVFLLGHFGQDYRNLPKYLHNVKLFTM